MITFQKLTSRWHLTIVAGAFLLVPHTSSCATTESNMPAQSPTQLIQQLRAAKELDLSNAYDLSVGPVAAGDYMLRADRANDVISDLEHGVRVPRAEVRDALFVPPKSFSETQRAELVKELQQAKWRDNRGWWDWTRDPVIAQNFSVQEKKADRVINELETDQPVSWHDIQEAMQVPPNY
jgi:hypothetical protein